VKQIAVKEESISGLHLNVDVLEGLPRHLQSFIVRSGLSSNLKFDHLLTTQPQKQLNKVS
jgi:hypothetical protein